MTPEQRNVYEQGLNAQQNQEFGTAIVCYQKLLEVAKAEERPQLSYLLGSCYLQTGEFDQARQYLHEAVNVSDPSLDAINNLGICYKALGQVAIAEKIFKGISSRVSAYVPALVNLAEIKEQQENLEEACLWYELAYRQSRDDFDVLLRFVVCLQKSGQHVAARQLILDALPRIPRSMLLDFYEILTNLSLHVKDYLGAQAALKELIAIDPDHAQAWCNLAWVCEHLGEFPQAIEAAQKAGQLTPEMMQAWNNLGLAYRAAHQLKAAEQSFLHGLAIQADDLISFNLGTTYLLEGNYAAGWAGFEHRFKLGAKQAPLVDVPVWQTDPPSGLHILVYADQGFGDILQFSRFLTALQRFEPQAISVVVPTSMVELLAWNFSKVTVLAEDDELPQVDFQVSLSSLAGRLDVTLETLPEFHHKWTVPAETQRTWRTWAAAQPQAHMRIGVNWMGNPQQTRDYLRSCPWDVFSRLTETSPEIQFYSLSIDPEARQQVASSMQPHVVDLGGNLPDFSHTAAAIQQMDLVITIDSALAHLAGSLSAPTWTLLSHTPDWRWHLDRADSPWYPSMRLFRQPTWNDWPGLIKLVAEQLKVEFNPKSQISHHSV